MYLARIRHSIIVFFLLYLKGLFIEINTVNDSTDTICNLTGSTVVLSSSCPGPKGSKDFGSWTWISDNGQTLLIPRTNSRYKYSRNDTDQICFLKIMDLNKTDTGIYNFSLTQKTDKNSVVRSITVYVTDLQVYVDRDTVTEGQNILLTCNTSCALNLTANSHPFIWYKNKTRLGPEHSSNKLNLIAVSSEDTGRYSCALKDLETFASEERLITVNHSCVWNKRTGIVLSCLLILVILLFICGTLRMKRRKLKRTGEKQHNIEIDPVNSNIAALAETFDLEERERSHQDEVQYSIVHFMQHGKVKNTPAIFAQKAESLYAAINVSEQRSATE